jgi:hypothetical protein
MPEVSEREYAPAVKSAAVFPRTAMLVGLERGRVEAVLLRRTMPAAPRVRMRDAWALRTSVTGPKENSFT